MAPDRAIYADRSAASRRPAVAGALTDDVTDKPPSSEYAPFYAAYVAAVPDGPIVDVLGAQAATLRARAGAVPPARETWRYAPGKWSIRELVGHVTDVERVFGHRAFCISRGEAAPLPAFEENEYIAAARYDQRPLEEIVGEFALVRGANVAMLRALAPDDWTRIGVANSSRISVRALAFILAWHVQHHLEVLRLRYGV